jgi:CRISPR/Cas system-associated exonuclease Cas4 (RecB family)
MMGIVKNLKFKKTEGFDPNEFAKLFEKAYEATARSGKDTKKTTFSPSTVGYGHGNCARYWFIAFTGADFDETNDAQSLSNMLNGTYAHDRIQKIMENTGVLKETEKEIKNEDPPIRGFVDLIIEWEGKDVVGEIKTTKDEVFAIRQSQMKPAGYHTIQLLMYMKVLEINQGFVMYENKNTQEICIIPVDMNEKNQELINNVFDWLRNVYANYKSGEIPARSFTKSSYQCKGCPARTECWKKLEDSENKIDALVIPK